MIVNDEALYKESMLNFIISFDGQFIFIDVYDYIPATNRTIESLQTSSGDLYSVETNIDLPDTLEIIAVITRQQRFVLQDYIDNKRRAMLLFTNTVDQTLSFKYSQTRLLQPNFHKKIVSASDVRTTLSFQCTSQKPA